jgi:2-succinyl-5-enolpyruvyl-6-hydroxy-3-cyclohexene-1-carboxylate synthase
MSRFIQDAEKAQLQRTVQEGDRTLDPSQSEAWAIDGTFQIGDFPRSSGPRPSRGSWPASSPRGSSRRSSTSCCTSLELPEEISFQANVIYTLPNTETLSVPYSNFIRYTRENGKLKFKTYRVYINTEGGW